jgi:hypothetical protein
MSVEKVIERLGTAEGTLSVSREVGGKIRVTSLLWPEAKVILKDEVLEIRNVDERGCTVPARSVTLTNGTLGRAL